MNGESTVVSRCTIGDLLPFPYIYRYTLRKSIVEKAESFGKTISTDGWTARQLLAYQAACVAANGDTKAEVHPILFGAAVLYSDNSIEKAYLLKGLEYGCTACPVVQLLHECEKRKHPKLLSPSFCLENGDEYPKAEVIVQVDQYGVAHAPFASARALLTEHGYDDVQILVHSEVDGTARVCNASNLCPPPPGAEMLTHDDFF